MATVQVNVKPVFAQLIHSGPYEGPCRVGAKERLTPEAERREGRSRFDEYVRELRDNLGPHVHLLEPVYMEWKDDFVLPEAELAKLESDVHAADLILVAPSGLPQYPAVALGWRYGKPIGMMGWVASIDIVAYLRSRGMEGFAFLDYDDLNHVLSLLGVRKAFRRMRILVAGEGNTGVPTGVVSSIWDLEGLKRRYGVDYTVVPAMDLVTAMDRLAVGQDGEFVDVARAYRDFFGAFAERGFLGAGPSPSRLRRLWERAEARRRAWRDQTAARERWLDEVERAAQPDPNPPAVSPEQERWLREMEAARDED